LFQRAFSLLTLVSISRIQIYKSLLRPPWNYWRNKSSSVPSAQFR